MIPKLSRLIYVAGKYRAPSKAGVEANIADAETATIGLVRAGWGVICPHKNTSGFEKFEKIWKDLSSDTWITMDLTILERCDAIFMLRGWKESKGANIEYTLAKSLGIQIFHEENYKKGVYPSIDLVRDSDPDYWAWKAWTRDCRNLMWGKRRDYCASGADPLGNLRLCGASGVITRLSDKIMRLITLVVKRKEPQVISEPVLDAMKDGFNYFYLAWLMKLEEDLIDSGVYPFLSTAGWMEDLAGFKEMILDKAKKEADPDVGTLPALPEHSED